MSKLTEKPYLYLAESAAIMADICAAIEANEDDELPKDLLDSFRTTKEQLYEGIDRRKAVADQFRATIAMVKEHGRKARAAAKKLEIAFEKFRESTKDVIESHPEISFRDSMKKKVYVCKSKPKLKLALPAANSKSFSNILDDGAIELLEIPERFLRQVTFRQLDTDKVRQALEGGEELDFAELEAVTQLRGL